MRNRYLIILSIHILKLEISGCDKKVTFSHTWRALPGYFLPHKVTSLNRKDHTEGSNFVSREVTLCRMK
jgi:hypothetical protein